MNKSLAEIDNGKARKVCEHHHWISKHQPDLPIYWIIQCSICGDYNAEEMSKAINSLIAAARKEELKYVQSGINEKYLGQYVKDRLASLEGKDV